MKNMINNITKKPLLLMMVIFLLITMFLTKNKSYAEDEESKYIEIKGTFTSDNGNENAWPAHYISIDATLFPQSKIFYISKANVSGGGGTYGQIGRYSVDLLFTLKDGTQESTRIILFDDIEQAQSSYSFNDKMLDYSRYEWINDVKDVEVISVAYGKTGFTSANALTKATLGKYQMTDLDNVYSHPEKIIYSDSIDNGNSFSNRKWTWYISGTTTEYSNGAPRGKIYFGGEYWYLANYKSLIVIRTSVGGNELNIPTVNSGTLKYGHLYSDIDFFKGSELLMSKSIINRGPNEALRGGENDIDSTKSILIKLDTPEIPNSIRIKTRAEAYNSFTTFKLTRIADMNTNIIDKTFKLNTPPKITTLSTPTNNYTITNDPGTELSKLEVRGFVRDDDNDNLTITAELAGISRSVVVKNTSTAKEFVINFDAYTDEIREGIHILTLVVSDGKLEDRVKRTIIVKKRVKNGAYILVNEPVYYETEYEDEENDPKFGEEYKFIHDPSYFENGMGLFTDSGIWSNLAKESFDKTGLYEGVFRVEDNPKSTTSFSEFRRLSKESMSQIEFKVHRAPIAIFSVGTTRNGNNYNITISDSSYDLDHISKKNKGIYDREWQYKMIDDVTWTSGKLPNTITYGERYIQRLRVRDIDGEGGRGIWSDWTEVEIYAGNSTIKPVALFILNPSSATHSQNIEVIDKSFSSSERAITRWDWEIKYPDGSVINKITTTNKNVPTFNQLKAMGLGKYILSLVVYNGYYSDPYELPYEITNNPPEAKFESPDTVYRDTNIVLNNTTPADKDGDEVNYKWKLKQPSGTEYDISTSKSPTFNIQSFINSKNIEPINAISNRWEIKLIAADSLGASSTYSRDLEVINHKPTSSITGSGEVGQFTTHTYTSGGNDNDTADRTTLVYRWNIIKPSGELADVIGGKTIDIYFDEVGIYKIEHWVIDQIGDESTKATKIVNVVENEPPKMRIVNLSNRRSIPASITSDPFPIEWEYTDKENDYQEKYSLDFYYYDVDILEEIEEDEYIETIQEDDILNNTFSGDIYEYLVNKNRFEMFRPIKIKGRVFSNNNWSEFSNDAYFIINNSPTNDFSLNKTRFVREEAIKVTGWGNDTDIINGDNLTFDYYYRKKGSSEWVELYYIHTSDEALSPSNDYRHSFEFNINSLAANKKEEIYEIRQVVTDSLGTNGHEKIREVVIENRKATVEITEPNSADKNNPSGLADLDLRPTIEWKYEDLDGDVQKKYRVYIYQGDTNTVVMDSGEKNGLVSTFKSPLALVEETLYSVIVEVYDGHEWSSSARKFFKVFSLKLENLKITGVYDIAWRDLFVGANNLSTGYAISVPINQITPLSRHPSKPSTPIKLGYKVEFEIDAKGLVDSADKVDTSIRFLDVNGNDVSSQVKYINDNGQNIAITNKYKSAVATVVSRNGVNSVWKFSYFMPATTQVGNLNDLIVETTIKATKSSNNITYNYNEKTGWNGRLFQYTLKTNALNDYYIQGGN